MIIKKPIWYKLIFLGVCFCLLAGCNNADAKETVSGNEPIETATLDISAQSTSENDVSEISSENLEIVTNKKFELKDEVEAALGYMPDEYQKDKEYDDWFEKYSSIVSGSQWIKNDAVVINSYMYYLAYIDDDDIPELIVYDGHYFDILILNGGKCGFGKRDYIVGYNERTGKILCEEHDLDWDCRICGYVYDKGSIEEEIVADVDDTGEYDVLGYSVTQDSYNEFYDFFDLENVTEITNDNCYSTVEILYVMKTGHDSSYTHRYEVIYEDVTWEEAQEICKEKGGYLAVITSQEELNRIKELFSDRDELAVCYIGCKGTYANDDRRWYLKNGNTIEIGGGNIYVFPYDNTSGVSCLEIDYENETMDHGFLVYGKLNDYDNDSDAKMLMGPNDIVSSDPNLSGKVGFICEYDE